MTCVLQLCVKNKENGLLYSTLQYQPWNHELWTYFHFYNSNNIQLSCNLRVLQAKVLLRYLMVCFYLICIYGIKRSKTSISWKHSLVNSRGFTVLLFLLYDIKMSIYPPHSVGDKVHCQTIGPREFCGDYPCEIAAIHINTANVWWISPVSPENVTVTYTEITQRF